MSELSIRVTHRTEIDGRAVEKTIDIETIPPLRIENITPAEPSKTMMSALGDGLLANVDTRFRRIFDRPGTPDRSDSHVAVLDQTTGLMWSIESLGDPADPDAGITQEHCIERCKQLRLLGFDDWRLPTRAELVTLIDDTRHEPAIDTEYFPSVKPRWHWTSTASAWSASVAWLVYFGYGGVDCGLRGGDGFALACRRAGQ